MKKDTYKTLSKPAAETLFKDKGSKFIGYAFPIQSEEDVKVILEELWKKHSKASHICYAWQLGKRYEQYRANDDGEPSNSAGMPIYGQLKSFEITQVLVAVVRYYGGVNLGVGGLINAYRSSAQLTLEGASIVTKTIKTELLLTFDYPLMNPVMRVIKERNLKVVDQKMHLDCNITLAVRQLNLKDIQKRFERIYGVTLTVLED